MPLGAFGVGARFTSVPDARVFGVGGLVFRLQADAVAVAFDDDRKMGAAFAKAVCVAGLDARQDEHFTEAVLGKLGGGHGSELPVHADVAGPDHDAVNDHDAGHSKSISSNVFARKARAAAPHVGQLF